MKTINNEKIALKFTVPFISKVYCSCFVILKCTQFVIPNLIIKYYRFRKIWLAYDL